MALGTEYIRQLESLPGEVRRDLPFPGGPVKLALTGFITVDDLGNLEGGLALYMDQTGLDRAEAIQGLKQVL